jgi:uncharacterized membrane protein
VIVETGILLAFGVALLKGVQSVYQRKNSLETDEFITAWSSRVFGLPVLAAALLYTGIPQINPMYLFILIPQSLVIAFTSILIAKAYKESEASIVTPMFALSPVLVVGTSFLILGETLSMTGIIGVLLIALGTYVLKLKGVNTVLEPFRKLSKERGVQLIMIVILIYSITANTDKIGVKMTSPVLWPLSVYALSSLFMLPVMMKKSSNWKSQVKTSWKPLALLGGLGGLSIILQMTAFKLTLVTYVIAIKRFSIPITLLISYILLNERDDFPQRLIGSLIMVAGAVLINI